MPQEPALPLDLNCPSDGPNLTLDGPDSGWTYLPWDKPNLPQEMDLPQPVPGEPGERSPPGHQGKSCCQVSGCRGSSHMSPRHVTARGQAAGTGPVPG